MFHVTAQPTQSWAQRLLALDQHEEQARQLLVPLDAWPAETRFSRVLALSSGLVPWIIRIFLDLLERSDVTQACQRSFGNLQVHRISSFSYQFFPLWFQFSPLLSAHTGRRGLELYPSPTPLCKTRFWVHFLSPFFMPSLSPVSIQSLPPFFIPLLPSFSIPFLWYGK